MIKTVYIRLDVDNAGDNIELALLNANYIRGQNIHDIIQENINSTLKKIKTKKSTEILMRGSDDILFSIEKSKYELIFLENLKTEFKLNTGFSISIGVGKSIKECMLNLKIAKISGKNKIVEPNW